MVSTYNIYMCRAIKGGELAKSSEQWLVHTVNTFKKQIDLSNNIHSICESIFTTDKVAKETKSAILILILSNKKKIKSSLAET